MFNITPLACCLLLMSPQEDVAPRSNDSVIAKVGDEEIMESHLQLVAILSGHSEVTPALRKELTKRLVETRYVGRFLKRSRVKVNSAEVRQLSKDARARLMAKGVDLRRRMKQLKLSETDLRKELEVTKLWTRYKIKTITTDMLRERFKQRKSQYDGTQVRASQVFLKVATDDDTAWQKARQKLADIRSEVLAGNMKFTDAAQEYSESPSAKDGGDVGWFPYSGVMPRDFCAKAYELKKGGVSQPFRSRFGAHLITVTGQKPGDLSLEDARPALFRELERETWNKIVAAEKKADGASAKPVQKAK